jgi:hypothetical protein
MRRAPIARTQCNVLVRPGASEAKHFPTLDIQTPKFLITL